MAAGVWLVRGDEELHRNEAAGAPPSEGTASGGTPHQETAAGLPPEERPGAPSSGPATPGEEPAAGTANETPASGDEAGKGSPSPAFVLQLEQHIAFLNTKLEEAERLKEQTLAAARSREQELDRVRERLERDREKRLFLEKSRVFSKLLDPLDNIERCLAAATVSGDVKAMQDGLALVLKAFQGALSSVGLERFDPTGQPFDPQCHEAISVIPAQESAQAEKVFATYLAGYKLDDQVIRHARVVVARNQN